MTNAAIFVRVSKQSQDYERQIHDLQRHAERQGYKVVEVIAEKVSGAKDNSAREGIETLLRLARSGKIHKVLVTEVSRLGRKTSEVLAVIEEFCELGVSVYAQNYNLETLTAAGKRNPVASLLFTLLAEFARVERETLVERIHSGLEQARRRGIKLGRPFGTGKSVEQLQTEYAHVIRYLRQGYSLRKTAKLADVSLNTVRKVKKAINQ